MTATATINQTFLNNMRALWRGDARLAQQIDELPLDASLKIELTKRGVPTALQERGDGRPVYLHSRYDPQREAEELCAALDFDDAACVVLSGLGLGYVARALALKFGDETRILVGEPDLVTIKSALENLDLSAEIAAGQIEFLTRYDTGYLHERLRGHWATLMMGTRYVVPAVSREIHGEFHAAFRQAIADFAAFARMSLMTLVRNAGVTCRNIANNLPAYVFTPRLDLLKGRSAGRPAILVAAGPSLAKNVDQLRDVRDRAVIIAAQTTLRPLLERGIRPHFVTALDYSEISRQFFEGVEIPGDLVLVAEPKVSWHVVDSFRGANASSHARVIFLDSPFAHRCLGTSLGKRAGLESGATVMHLAFYLAQWLGCDPIIFIGQDLAFTGHCYYAPGVAIHRAWDAELGRYCTTEMKEWERIVRHRNILRKTPDLEGRPIYTDEQMFTYLQQFERDFARSKSRVIDATEGGARKSGATVMPLREAIDAFCNRLTESSRFEFPEAAWIDRSPLPAARAMMAERLKELTSFQSLCRQTREILESLGSLVDRPAEFNRGIVRVDELRTQVQGYENIFQMVRDVSQLAEFQRMTADRHIDLKSTDEPARARRQLNRDMQFLDALLEGCERLNSILSDALERFDLEMKCNAQTTRSKAV